MPVYTVTTNSLCGGHSWGPVSTTSFGGGGGGGLYKTMVVIHDTFNSELGVDESEGAGMCSVKVKTCLFPRG